jgi:glycosyltransferase involved in cell wall biosynthesis
MEHISNTIDRPLKVLHLISSRGLYGAERVVINLTEAMDRQRFIPQVALLRNEGYPNIEFIEAFKKTKVHVFPAKKWIDIKAIQSIKQLIIDEQFDIIHCHEMKGRLYALLCVCKRKNILITTHHNWIKNDFITSLFETFDAFYIRFFNRIIAVSYEVKNMLLKTMIPNEKIEVIINGIDTDHFKVNKDYRKKTRKELSVTDNIKLVGSFGRISYEKGHIYFVKAAIEVLKKNPNTKFLIIGNGPQEEEIKKYVLKQEASGSIFFLDFKENIKEYYSALDIFVLPSIIEGTPMALIEAMSVGIPVVAAKVGGVGNIIIHKENGMLVPPKDINQLSDAIIALLNDEKMSKFLSKNASATVASSYSAKRMAMEYSNIYSKLHIRDIQCVLLLLLVPVISVSYPY